MDWSWKGKELSKKQKKKINDNENEEEKIKILRAAASLMNCNEEWITITYSMGEEKRKDFSYRMEETKNREKEQKSRLFQNIDRDAAKIENEMGASPCRSFLLAGCLLLSLSAGEQKSSSSSVLLLLFVSLSLSLSVTRVFIELYPRAVEPAIPDFNDANFCTHRV